MEEKATTADATAGAEWLGRPVFVPPREAARGRSSVAMALALCAAVPLLAQASVPIEGDRLAIEARRSAAEQRAQRLAAAAAARAREAAAVHRRIAALAKRVAAGEQALHAAETHLRAAEQARAIAADRLAAERAPLARLLAAMVRDARRPAALALVAPDRLAQSERRRVALAAIRPVIEARGAAVRASLARSEAAALQAAAALRVVRLAQTDVARERRALVDAEAGLIGGRALILADAGAAREQAQGLAEQAAGLDAQIVALRRDARLGARLATLDGPPPRPLFLARPGSRRPAYRLAAVGRVLIGEGERSLAGVRARGLTLATAPGTSVVAPAAGRIAYAGPFRAWRAIVIVDHGRGWITLVTGLDRAAPRVGDRVTQGEAIGRASGRVTIELRHRGRPVDVTGMVEAS